MGYEMEMRGLGTSHKSCVESSKLLVALTWSQLNILIRFKEDLYVNAHANVLGTGPCDHCNFLLSDPKFQALGCSLPELPALPVKGQWSAAVTLHGPKQESARQGTRFRVSGIQRLIKLKAEHQSEDASKSRMLLVWWVPCCLF